MIAIRTSHDTERQPAQRVATDALERARPGRETAMHSDARIPSDPAPTLRLWTPDVDTDEPGGISPRMTLCDFFDEWYLPIVLSGERAAARKTVLIYRDALRYWTRLTGNPRIEDLTDYTTATFASAMRTATYRRGKLGAEQPLRPRTQRKLIGALRAVLVRVGPTVDPRRRGKGLLREAPQLVLERPSRTRVKPAFDIADARRIFAAAGTAEWHWNKPGRGSVLRQPQSVPAHLLLPAWIACLYYTGQRTGTTLLLDWSMVRERAGGVWFEIDERCVPKTHKAVDVYCHPDLHALLLAVRRANTNPQDQRLFPFQGCYKALVTRHRVLQQQAGIPAERRQSPQAWRRTHATELAKVGAQSGYEAARRALDHSSESVTKDFYVNIQPELVGRLPLLAEHRDTADRQRRLFE